MKIITAEEIYSVQQGEGKLKMRGNAPVPDFKLHTGASSLLSYAKLKNNCSADVSRSLKKRLGGTGVQQPGLLSFC